MPKSKRVVSSESEDVAVPDLPEPPARKPRLTLEFLQKKIDASTKRAEITQAVIDDLATSIEGKFMYAFSNGDGDPLGRTTITVRRHDLATTCRYNTTGIKFSEPILESALEHLAQRNGLTGYRFEYAIVEHASQTQVQLHMIKQE